MIVLELIGGLVIASLIVRGVLVMLEKNLKKREEKENNDGK